MPERGGAARWLDWLASTPVAVAMREHPWLYPAVETVHILGFVVLVGAVAMFDLRLLGCARSLPVRALGRHLLGWSAGAALAVVPAGLALFSAHPHDFAGNRVFLLKLALIGAAAANAALFHCGVYRTAGRWNLAVAAPPLARLHALVSLAAWTAVICCGRLLAYT